MMIGDIERCLEVRKYHYMQVIIRYMIALMLHNATFNIKLIAFSPQDQDNVFTNMMGYIT